MFNRKNRIPETGRMVDFSPVTGWTARVMIRDLPWGQVDESESDDVAEYWFRNARPGDTTKFVPMVGWATVDFPAGDRHVQPVVIYEPFGNAVHASLYNELVLADAEEEISRIVGVLAVPPEEATDLANRATTFTDIVNPKED